MPSPIATPQRRATRALFYRPLLLPRSNSPRLPIRIRYDGKASARLQVCVKVEVKVYAGKHQHALRKALNRWSH